MTDYAKNTTVTIAKSREEVQKLLDRFGAEGFAYSEQKDGCSVGFSFKGYKVRFFVHYKPESEFDIAPPVKAWPMGRNRTPVERKAAREQSKRESWRVLVLNVKSKLVAIDQGVRDFFEEFAHDVIMPDGQTIGEYTANYIEAGRMPPMLPGARK